MKQNMSLISNVPVLLQDAHGSIPYNMTNDYMFRAVLQSNNNVLRGLFCSLLHLSETEVIFVEITNPIILGKAIENKEFRLDINIRLYSDNFTLGVVDLSRIDLATEEDKEYYIDYWARLFKASTWEEIIMLASENKYLNEASNTIFQLSADEQIRKQCRDREEYYQDLRNYERVIAEKDASIENLRSLLRKHGISEIE